MMQQYSLMINDIEVMAEYDEEDIQKIFLPMLLHLSQKQKALQRRMIVFMAAPAGCGKTTLSQMLSYLSKQHHFTTVQALGMDGFHYPNAYLKTHTLIEEGKEILLKERKGAKNTFDVEGLKEKLEKLQKEDVMWPNYSRKIHDVISDQIPVVAPIILLEGNYLLLEDEVWEQVQTYCDESIFLYTEEKILKERIIHRKMQGGLSLKEAQLFYEQSDKKNIEEVLKHSKKADYTWKVNEQGRWIQEVQDEN